MSRVTSVVRTEAASRYLQQLCKHWSHRFDVKFDTAEGTVALPSATLLLKADPTSLHLALDGSDPELPRLGEVVADHLKRFAFRETLEIVWNAPLD